MIIFLYVRVSLINVILNVIHARIWRGCGGGIPINKSNLLNSLGKLIQKIGLKNTIIPLPLDIFFSGSAHAVYVPICATEWF